MKRLAKVLIKKIYKSPQNSLLDALICTSLLVSKVPQLTKTEIYSGIVSTAHINVNFSTTWAEVYEEFFNMDKDKYDGIDSFSDIEQDLKFSKLYLPICELYSEFINKYGGGNSNRFFSWFSGSKDYLKIISWTKKSEISIQDYNISDILPEKVCSWIELSDEANPYIYIRFSNDWIFTARLKNDSRVISKMQTKFDVKHYQGAPKKLTIKF